MKNVLCFLPGQADGRFRFGDFARFRFRFRRFGCPYDGDSVSDHVRHICSLGGATIRQVEVDALFDRVVYFVRLHGWRNRTSM